MRQWHLRRRGTVGMATSSPRVPRPGTAGAQPLTGCRLVCDALHKHSHKYTSTNSARKGSQGRCGAATGPASAWLVTHFPHEIAALESPAVKAGIPPRSSRPSQVKD